MEKVVRSGILRIGGTKPEQQRGLDLPVWSEGGKLALHARQDHAGEISSRSHPSFPCAEMIS